MKDSLRSGLEHELSFEIPDSKTVPALYPEAPEFQAMPEVFATGFLVGLVEWACIQTANPHLDWPEEQTVGAAVNLSHDAPTPQGMVVTAHVRLREVDGRRLTFDVQASDQDEIISRGDHQRVVIQAERFERNTEAKRARQGIRA